MTTMTRQAVACAWCGTEGAGICPDCAENYELIEKYLDSIGKNTPENRRRAMETYLTSRWAKKVNGQWICKNSECGYVALVLAAECPMCGCRGGRGNEKVNQVNY